MVRRGTEGIYLARRQTSTLAWRIGLAFCKAPPQLFYFFPVSLEQRFSVDDFSLLRMELYDVRGSASCCRTTQASHLTHLHPLDALCE